MKNQNFLVRVVFNTKSKAEKEKAQKFALNEMAFERQDAVLIKHIFSATVSGPMIPIGMKREDHPDKNKVFVTLRTDDPEAVRKRLSQLTDIDFELRD